MTSSAQFVAGDWGTSNLRLFLCNPYGDLLEQIQGPGAAQVPGAHAATLAALIEPWQRGREPLEVILCGMVGSRLGWIEVPYVRCPAQPKQIADGCSSEYEGRIRIIPGLSCRNCFDAPDVMRGEETQILGALSLEQRLLHGRHLLCLPGTHSKWVVLEDGSVSEFLTAPTGELHALLCEGSVLVQDREALPGIAWDAGFEKGARAFNQHPRAQLLHRLFECRSRRLSEEIDAGMQQAFLSGMLIASDIRGALDALPASNAAITLIGAPRLTALYSAALRLNQVSASMIDGALAAITGLVQVHQICSSQRF